MPVSTTLYVIGLNYRTAPVTVREAFPGDREHVEELLRHQRGLVGELVFLGTCNRSEWIVQASPEQLPWLIDDICAVGALPREAFARYFYIHEDMEARRHLFRVGSGLDSMVVGETQILGQLKDALTYAMAVGCAETCLHTLFQRIYCVARQVRSQTRLGEGAVSVGSLAVQTARDCCGDLAGARVALVGAGKLGELVGQHLHKQGVRQVRVLNRTAERARQVAAKLDGTAGTLDDLAQTLAWCDVMICTTASRQPLIRAESVAAAMQGRPERPLILIDIAVPRDVEPGVADLPGVSLHNIDELEQQLQQNQSDRAAEIPHAEAIVARSVANDARANHEVIGPLVRALHQRADELRDDQLERLFRRHDWDEDACEEIRQATRLIIRKLLHAPIRALHQQDLNDAERLAFVRELFDLNPTTETSSCDDAKTMLMAQS